MYHSVRSTQVETISFRFIQITNLSFHFKVKKWLKIEGKVLKPAKEDRNRPIEGMNVKRQEVSGQRLWGLFKKVSKTPEVSSSF